MGRSWLVPLAFVVALAVMPRGASGEGVCVAIDTARDNLAEDERAAVLVAITTALEREGVGVAREPAQCAATVVAYNVRLARAVTTTLASGTRGVTGKASSIDELDLLVRQLVRSLVTGRTFATGTGRATSLDELPNVYSQMVKSLVTGAPIGTGGGVVDRTNVTKDQSAPRRVAADNLKYVQLGYGAVTSARIAYGPAFGFGYRKELDRIGIDLSLTFLLANDTEVSDGATMSIPKLAVVWNQEPTSDSSAYYGIGVSYGSAAVHSDGMLYGGSGLQGHLIGGYEMFRSSTIRGFIQLDATLPFYKSTGDSETDTRWPVSAALSLGLGWGKSNVVRVINE